MRRRLQRPLGEGNSSDSEAPVVEVDERFLKIGATDEEPVPFELDAILDAVGDEARGARHFPGYRVREEQLSLVREFVHVFADGGIAKLEGGTGVGKSLAYLAAAIPFAMSKAASHAKDGDKSGNREPVVFVDPYEALAGSITPKRHRCGGTLSRLSESSRAFDQGPCELCLWAATDRLPRRGAGSGAA